MSTAYGRAVELVEEVVETNPEWVRLTWTDALFRRYYDELAVHVDTLIQVHTDLGVVGDHVTELARQFIVASLTKFAGYAETQARLHDILLKAASAGELPLMVLP